MTTPKISLEDIVITAQEKGLYAVLRTIPPTNTQKAHMIYEEYTRASWLSDKIVFAEVQMLDESLQEFLARIMCHLNQE